MSRAEKSDIFNEEETLESLFESAKSLEIIPPDFSPDFFKKNFFYLFIERKFKNFEEDPEDQEFSKHAFGEKYCQSMLQAFQFVFDNAKTRQLDVDVIHELYLIATNKAIGDDLRSYRVDGCSTGFMHFEASKKYFNVEMDSEPTLNLLSDRSFGLYYFEKEDSLEKIGGDTVLEIRCDIDEASEEEIKADVKALIDEYYSQMQQIKTQDFQDELQRKEKKLALISIFVNYFVRYHPYADGNGRLSCFLLLNYLLISENLTPAMVFNPWQISYSAAEELPILVKEGQLAYEIFFKAAQEIDDEDLGRPLNEKIDDFYPFEEIEIGQIVLNISEIIICSLQAAAIGDAADEELQKRKAHLIELVEKNKQYLEVSDYDEVFSYQLPICSDGWMEDMILVGLLGLFSEVFPYGKSEASEESEESESSETSESSEASFNYNNLRQKLTDAEIFDDEILDKEKALQKEDYQKIHQAIAEKFPEKQKICDRYFKQVSAFLERFGEEITFKEAAEFLKEISEQEVENDALLDVLDRKASLVGPKEALALSRDGKSLPQVL